MAKPIVAIVGRPNVGKSTLFNKIVGQRLSIVEDTPGVTRDRIFGDAEWCGRKFSLVDTGGIEPDTRRRDSKLRCGEQAQIAIDNADVIILVTDMQHRRHRHRRATWPTMLLKSGKPVVLCVNKCDTVGEPAAGVLRVLQPGPGRPRRGVLGPRPRHRRPAGRVCATSLPAGGGGRATRSDVIKVAVIGKPNVGKSSLVNRIAGRGTGASSPTLPAPPGTRWTPPFENQHGHVYLYRHRRHPPQEPRWRTPSSSTASCGPTWRWSAADVCVILIDATGGLHRAGLQGGGPAPTRQGKACIIAVNKWDAVEKDGKTMQRDAQKAGEGLLLYVLRAHPVYLRQDRPAAGQAVRADSDCRRPAERHAHFHRHAQRRSGPGHRPGAAAHRQGQAAEDLLHDPGFHHARLRLSVSATGRELFHFSYQRYLENRIRETFGLEGTPVRMVIRERGEKD